MFAGMYLMARRGRNLGNNSSATKNTHDHLRLLDKCYPQDRCESDANQFNDASSIVSHFKSLMTSSINGSSSDSLCRSISQRETSDSSKDEWIFLRNEIHKIQSVLLWEVQRLPHADQTKVLSCLKDSLIKASKQILTESCEETILDEMEEKYFVWSSAYEARRAILQEAITFTRLRDDGECTNLYTPLVIVIAETTNSLDCNTGINSQINPPDLEADDFLRAWKKSSVGMAEVITITAESASKTIEMVEGLINTVTQERRIVPVLIVMHVPSSSTISSDISTIRTLCDSYNMMLCVEGPGIAMLAQYNRPPHLEEYLELPDVVILDQGEWFAFKSCAIVSKHGSWKRRNMTKEDYEFLYLSPRSPLILYSADGLDGRSISPVINLWTVLMRIGVSNMKAMIESAVVLAESFVEILENSSNLEVSIEGLGCIARLTYAFSRDSRMLAAEQSERIREQVNQMLASRLQHKLGSLCLKKVTIDGNSFLQFTPVLLLRSHRISLPTAEEVQEYGLSFQYYVDQFESCRAASVAFSTGIVKVRDIQTVNVDDDVPYMMTLDVGRFRVVPHELQSTWRNDVSQTQVVEALMDSLIVMVNGYQNGNEGRYLSNTTSGLSLAEKGSISSVTYDEDATFESSDSNDSSSGWSSLAFYKLSLKNPNRPKEARYIAIEPKELLEPWEAVQYVQEFAHLLSGFVSTITEKWRMEVLTKVTDTVTPIENTEHLRSNKKKDEIQDVYVETPIDNSVSQTEIDEAFYSAGSQEIKSPASLQIFKSEFERVSRFEPPYLHANQQSNHLKHHHRRRVVPVSWRSKVQNNMNPNTTNSSSIPATTMVSCNEESNTFPQWGWSPSFWFPNIMRWGRSDLNVESSNATGSSTEEGTDQTRSAVDRGRYRTASLSYGHSESSWSDDSDEISPRSRNVICRAKNRNRNESSSASYEDEESVSDGNTTDDEDSSSTYQSSETEEEDSTQYHRTGRIYDTSDGSETQSFQTRKLPNDYRRSRSLRDSNPSDRSCDYRRRTKPQSSEKYDKRRWSKKIEKVGTSRNHFARSVKGSIEERDSIVSSYSSDFEQETRSNRRQKIDPSYSTNDSSGIGLSWLTQRFFASNTHSSSSESVETRRERRQRLENRMETETDNTSEASLSSTEDRAREESIGSTDDWIVSAEEQVSCTESEQSYPGRDAEYSESSTLKTGNGSSTARDRCDINATVREDDPSSESLLDWLKLFFIWQHQLNNDSVRTHTNKTTGNTESSSGLSPRQRSRYTSSYTSATSSETDSIHSSERSRDSSDYSSDSSVENYSGYSSETSTDDSSV